MALPCLVVWIYWVDCLDASLRARHKHTWSHPVEQEKKDSACPYYLQLFLFVTCVYCITKYKNLCTVCPTVLISNWFSQNDKCYINNNINTSYKICYLTTHRAVLTTCENLP